MTEVSSAQIAQARPVAQAFSPARLTLARHVAGRTKRQLAEAIDKTAAAVTQFELGQARPSAETLALCAQALDLPVAFFAGGRPQLVVDTGMAHFRSLRATRAYQREQAMGLIALLWEVVEAVEQVVELPSVSLPGVSDFARFGSPAEAARELRRCWGVGDGPVPHLVRHAEANGIVTSVLPRTLTGETAAGPPEHLSGVSNVDAFSTRVSQRSLIGLTGAKGGLLRRRFNVAHELGHLLLHPEARPGDHLHEREAHLFAAELLMPEASIVHELPARPDPGRLLPLQRRWGASVSALAFRGRTLGTYSEPQLKRLMITLSQLGWRTNEPEDQSLLEGEEPALLRQALELASSAGMNVSSLADQLKLPPSLVRTFLGIPDSKPRLTLLKKPLPAGRTSISLFGEDRCRGKRKSRQRRQRDATRSFDPRRIDWQAIRWEQIDQCVARFEGGALADLLGSAADSPGGVHRLPSLTILWVRCLVAPPTGRQCRANPRPRSVALTWRFTDPMLPIYAACAAAGRVGSGWF